MSKAKMAVRVDDVCPKMLSSEFYKTIELIESYGITGLLGIVPDCKDSNLNRENEDTMFWSKIQGLKDRGWIIAMHGYQHVLDKTSKSLVSGGLNTEFSSKNYEEQITILSKGLEVMKSKGLFTDVFFAPAHSYDKTTIYALRDLGFKYMSDGRSKYCYNRYGMKFIPCRVYGYPMFPSGIVTLAIHPCASGELGYKSLADYLSKNKDILVSYSELMEEKDRFLPAQLLDEKLFVFYIRYIHIRIWPLIVKMWSIIRKVFVDVK